MKKALKSLFCCFIFSLAALLLYFLSISIYSIYTNQWTLTMESTVSLISLLVTLLGFAFALYQHQQNVKKERIRLTLATFPDVRLEGWEAVKHIQSLASDKQADAAKKYLAKLEYFAVGINTQAYDIEIVNRMSGTMLIKQYNIFFKGFINERKAKKAVQRSVDTMYCEYLEMIKKLHALRGETWVE